MGPIAEVEVILNAAGIRSLTRFGGPVTPELIRRTRPIAARARALAPKSPDGNHGRPAGYLASRIHMEVGEDANGVYCDVVSDATAPDGFPYAKVQNVRRPYLRPAIRA